jgi:hypothetical protein
LPFHSRTVDPKAYAWLRAKVCHIGNLKSEDGADAAAEREGGRHLPLDAGVAAGVAASAGQHLVDVGSGVAAGHRRHDWEGDGVDVVEPVAKGGEAHHCSGRRNRILRRCTDLLR